MSRVFGLILWEVRLQARYYIYAGSVVTVALLSGMVAIMPVALPAEVVAVLILTETGVLGLFLVGVLVLMEKGEGTLHAVAVTPTPAWIYLLARTASLTVLTLAAGWVLVVLDFPGRMDIGVMLLGIGLTSAAAVLGGFVLVAGAQSINAYMARAIPLVLVLALPVLALAGLIEPWMVVILPSHASLLLLVGAMEPADLSRAEWIYAVVYLILWVVLGWFWALRIFDRSVVGDGR
jgi:fluoroquinolone transport system permease protein